MADAIVIYPDGTEKEISPEKKKFSLEELYKIIGCDLVERCNAKDGRVIIVDEEGLLKELEYNSKATELMAEHYLSNMFCGLRGIAVVCKKSLF